MKLQLPLLESFEEIVKELASEQTREDLDREEEGLPTPHPLGAVAGDSSTGNDAMDMRMVAPSRITPQVRPSGYSTHFTLSTDWNSK